MHVASVQSELPILILLFHGRSPSVHPHPPPFTSMSCDLHKYSYISKRREKGDNIKKRSLKMKSYLIYALVFCVQSKSPPVDVSWWDSGGMKDNVWNS